MIVNNILSQFLKKMTIIIDPTFSNCYLGKSN